MVCDQITYRILQMRRMDRTLIEVHINEHVVLGIAHWFEQYKELIIDLFRSENEKLNNCKLILTLQFEGEIKFDRSRSPERFVIQIQTVNTDLIGIN
jgi:hypothetical protein